MPAPHPQRALLLATRNPGDAAPVKTPEPEAAATPSAGWSSGICPVCNFATADVDPDGVLWCPACGYSKKGCYT